MYIAIDFDGTIVEHEYPEVGPPVPGALDWMKKFIEAGARLILWTMRSDDGPDGPMLAEAVEYVQRGGVDLFGINENPTQGGWTSSPKAYAKIYIDDAAAGCPLKDGHVDWECVGPVVLERIKRGY